MEERLLASSLFDRLIDALGRSAQCASIVRLRALGLLGIMVVLASCASSGPYRSTESGAAADALASKCQPMYADTDDRIEAISTDFQKSDADREAFLEGMQKTIADTPPDLIACWQTAHERHPQYDLYYAEFDDAGQATDLGKGTPYDQSQLHLVETSIKNALGTGKAAPGSRTASDTEQTRGLNIVVFTHGWHGNARADNDYSIEFKAILQDIALAETKYRARLAGQKNLPDIGRIPRRVVGIEIAWRGDSLLTPGMPFYSDSQNALNVWDRKVTAETISTGSVQELLAFLNEIYLDNSCHTGRPGPAVGAMGCDRVHLLSIGHSFGALINFRALVPRLETGLNVAPCHRVFGFGDMTILLNPAFEGARYRGLFNNAISRNSLIGPYFGAGPPGDCRPAPPAGQVQIPSIVTLQSLGDTATGNFFPLFRHLTTPFEQTLSDKEVIDKNNAVGWVEEYRTHTLALLPAGPVPADECQNNATSFCPFLARGKADATTHAAETARQGLLLSWQPGTPDLPDYMPLWVVAVDTAIMKDHGDFWNPQIVRLISVLFADAYEQTECLHGGLNAVTPAVGVGSQPPPNVAISNAFGDACHTRKTSNGKAS